MTQNTDYAAYETAARKYCELCGSDPDTLVQGDSGGTLLFVQVKLWTVVAKQMQSLETLRDCIEQHGPNATKVT